MKRFNIAVCGIPEKESVILIGGGHKFVTRWKEK